MNNLIGITGKKGSGKDTVAIILAMLYHNYEDYVIKKTIEDRLIVHSDYEIKKLAYPIKVFVANILGVHVEKLEDREFKEKELGEEWIYYHNWTDKRIIISKEQFNLLPKEKTAMWRKRVHTPRTLMQLIGTEVCRQIHTNFWVNSLFKDYSKGSICNCIQHEESNGCFHCDYSGYDITPSKWIISDMRFNNEAEAVKSRGGIIIKVNRDVDTTDTHKSERGIDKEYIDYVVDNNGSIENLINKVKKLKLFNNA